MWSQRAQYLKLRQSLFGNTKIVEMMSKKQISNLVALAVAIILMSDYFVSCENTNIGDFGSDHHRRHHNDGMNVKEGHDLAPAHHHNGSRKMEAGGVIRPNSGCPWEICNFFGEDCDLGCICLPVFMLCMRPIPAEFIDGSVCIPFNNFHGVLM
ncbi:hypothetical protein FNV43_RR25716 [Rhamnella rubrinervis]|uniref:Uncharacterized protein n=1 Tax=Rhamnella rubrinervis TaxID=2594499 RepID=A0A8K0DIC8_9ROSA|nr:hypothetical protein FNV43_RR25716 [Rhamnella rubrinervis]